jgi:hypothetical protein
MHWSMMPTAHPPMLHCAVRQAAGRDAPWAVVGVLSEKLPIRAASSGKPYSLWVLSDLTGAPTAVSLHVCPHVLLSDSTDPNTADLGSKGLSMLHAAGASAKLFLFGEAHDEHRQLSQGSLLAAWGGKVMPACHVLQTCRDIARNQLLTISNSVSSTVCES